MRFTLHWQSFRALAIPVRRISILFVAVLSGILFAFPRSTLATQALGSLAGTVSSGVDDAPVKSATVTLLDRDFEAVTDEEGSFFFAGLRFRHQVQPGPGAKAGN